jgi:tetratricopeptide (TPR) repeat protein
MDKSVLLIGKSYYYLGDYIKAERKFSEFISRLSASKYIEEAQLYLAKTQLRLENEDPAVDRLENLVKTSKNKSVVSESYQSIAENYLNKKDYENAIKNFKKAIELSQDDEFKAQMQFIVAAVTSKTNPKLAAGEFEKVLDYDPSFDLEFYAKYNSAKNLVLSGNFSKAQSMIEDLEVKYKDNAPFLGQIYYLKGANYEKKTDYKNALEQYYYVIMNYPGSISSADASFRIGNYYENVLKDYLNAFRYYRFSTEQSAAGSNSLSASKKTATFKKYFDLRSKITGETINTDYDSEFKRKTSSAPTEEFQIKEQGDEGNGKPGGLRMIFLTDSLETPLLDSFNLKQEELAQAKFELAELFLYDLNTPDSCEYYFKQSFDQSEDREFKAKVLFALAALYRSVNNNSQNEEVLKQIVVEYPTSTVANASRTLLNMSLVENVTSDSGDSLYFQSQEMFLRGDYTAALQGFRELITYNPSSVHLAKSLFGCGWIYENVIKNYDSAYFYYSSLVKNVPNSEAAAIVADKLSEYETYNKGIDSSGVLKDSSNLNSEDSLKNMEKPLHENLQEKIEEKTDPVKDDNSPLKKEGEVDLKGDVPVEDPKGDQK